MTFMPDEIYDAHEAFEELHTAESDVEFLLEEIREMNTSLEALAGWMPMIALLALAIFVAISIFGVLIVTNLNDIEAVMRGG